MRLQAKGQIVLPIGIALAMCVLSATANQLRADRDHGLLFYAGFDHGFNADRAQGDLKASFNGKPSLVAGWRGQALRCGSKEGNVKYAVEDNLRPDEGSIEMWIRPVDWAGNDHQFHVFFRAEDPGWLQLYKYGPSDCLLFITGVSKRDYTTAECFLMPEQQRGVWSHLVATWREGEVRLFFNGKEHPTMPPYRKWPLPETLNGFFELGDMPQDGQGVGSTLIDEVYIYGRALSEPEVRWIVTNAAHRAAGADLPNGIEPPMRHLQFDTDLSAHKILIEVNLNPRFAQLPLTANATLTATNGGAIPGIDPIKLRFRDSAFTGEMPYENLTKGAYVIQIALRDKSTGQIVTNAEHRFEYPGDGAEWSNNRIGLSDYPPKPWLPIAATAKQFECWERRYLLNGSALIGQIRSQGKDLLARPVVLAAVHDGKDVKWQPVSWNLVSADSNSAAWVGVANSEIGKLEWRVTAEFDGFTRFDLQLAPMVGASVDKLELRFPVKPERARYYYLDSNFSPYHKFGDIFGLTPAQPGEFAATDHALYCHLGDDERGLQMSIPSDEPWQEVDRKGMVRLERTTGSVDLVWSFAEKPWELPRPWKASFAVQATPVKPLGNWRKWRFSRQASQYANLPSGMQTNDLDSGTYYINNCNAMIFDGVVPLPDQPQPFRECVDNTHKQGEKYIQYLLADFTSPRHPVWQFRMKQYYNGENDGYWSSSYPSQDWMDWHAWMVDRFLRDYDQDGIYYDLSFVHSTGGRYGKTSDLKFYMRNGVRRKVYALYETRELYKRLYTAVKVYGTDKCKDTYIIAHTGTMPFMAIHGFADMAFQGEDIKGDYAKKVTLELLRVRGQSRPLGIGAYWLPQRQHWEADRVAQSQILLGRLLLQDVQVWNTYIDEKLVFEIYAAQNRFGGIVNADFLPYWSNGDAIKGQTEQVKASAYRNPAAGGSLITAVNLSDKEQRVILTLNFPALHAAPAAKVTNMLAQGKVESSGPFVTVTIPPLSFAIFQVK